MLDKVQNKQSCVIIPYILILPSIKEPMEIIIIIV